MDTSTLKKFAQTARRQLLEEVAARLEHVLSTDSIEIREKEKAVNELQGQIKKTSKEAVIDQVAYTWFNRFCALRYMDVNHYTRIGIVSPQEGFTQPEILQEAKQGVIDDTFKVDKKKIIGLLNGTLPSSNSQQEAYRLLLVGACNAYHTQMPFLFPQINDYTELLMPDDLLSENSILQAVRETLSIESCQDVEVIGWLYQFYISERKDEVFAALKKNKKIESKEIPAATQLFTPHWIVRYLVENSLGRLWMLNHPESKLVEQMDYYIQLVEPESDFLEIQSPEEIKVCDPACGSGHMLTYAFDLLYTIYEEQGYNPVHIPSLIIKNNLYGIEIDQRAGHLAAFALMMKARKRDRRFFNREVEPNICVFRNITFLPNELESYKKKLGPSLFTQNLWLMLQQFEQSENLGSLIRPRLKNVKKIKNHVENLDVLDDLILHSTNGKVKKVLEFAGYLSSNYHILVSNPPYMGWGNMNVEFKKYVRNRYNDSKFDAFTMFMVRNLELVLPKGFVAMITIPSWMFLSVFKNLRKHLLETSTIICLNNNGRGVWGSDFGSTSFVLCNRKEQFIKGVFRQLFNKRGSVCSNDVLIKRYFNKKDYPKFFVNSTEILQVPGYPIAFWIGENVRKLFEHKKLGEEATVFTGMVTGNNKKFVRYWFEVPKNKLALKETNYKKLNVTKTYWVPYNKGGESRNWYGNQDYVVNFRNRGKEFNRPKSQYSNYYLRPCFSWTYISSSSLATRYFPPGFLWDIHGSSVFHDNINELLFFQALIGSKVGFFLLNIINSTISVQAGDVSAVPIVYPNSDMKNRIVQLVKRNIKIANDDWDSFETSWDFSCAPLLPERQRDLSLSRSYHDYRDKWIGLADEMLALTIEINKIFIDTYDVGQKVSSQYELSEITLFNNPANRYKTSKKGEGESRILSDSMKEFISYSVGCMLGRYSLDKKGLILANAGDTLEDYLRYVPEPSFIPDADNVIPILEDEWFEDDIAERFKDFLKITFGEENFEENLAFLEEAIGRDIRSFFVKEFYDEHVKMYKKRPIYWLFSSPKGSFNALIYMHRYTPDTVSVILNKYLVPYRDKLKAHKSLLETRLVSTDASQGEKTQASREIDQINKILSELKEYEDEILYPLATQQIEIDLDDGVLDNYNKFDKALKKVPGLSGK